MPSQNDRGGNYLKFDYFVRENHKPEGKLMGRAGNEEYCEKEEEKEFSFYVLSLEATVKKSP